MLRRNVTLTASAGKLQLAYQVDMSWNAVYRHQALYHKRLRVTAACCRICLQLEALVHMSV